LSDGELDRLRTDYDDPDREDTDVLLALLIMAVGLVLATTGAQIVRWLL
jgi:hypothetical protein